MCLYVYCTATSKVGDYSLRQPTVTHFAIKHFITTLRIDQPDTVLCSRSSSILCHNLGLDHERDFGKL